MRIPVFLFVLVTVLTLVACFGTNSDQRATWDYAFDDDTKGAIVFSVPKDWIWFDEDVILGPESGTWGVYLEAKDDDDIFVAASDVLPITAFGMTPESVSSESFKEDFKRQVAIRFSGIEDAVYASTSINGRAATIVTGKIALIGGDIGGITEQRAYISKGSYVWVVNCMSPFGNDEKRDICGSIIFSTRIS